MFSVEVMAKTGYHGCNMSNAQNEYSTKDLYVSAYLLMSGESLNRVDEVAPKRFLFVFDHSDSLISAVEKFYAKRVMVDPMEYVVAMKQLKGKMYDRPESTSHGKQS